MIQLWPVATRSQPVSHLLSRPVWRSQSLRGTRRLRCSGRWSPSISGLLVSVAVTTGVDVPVSLPLYAPGA